MRDEQIGGIAVAISTGEAEFVVPRQWRMVLALERDRRRDR
jgi:hypothetical protein